MRQKLSETKHSMKMMSGCAALILVAVIVALATNAYVFLLIVPCMLMMWMMMGGMGDKGKQP